MADEPLLRVEDLQKSFGGVAAVDGVSMEVRRGEVHAVIGPNGAGKTTLISLLAGELRPDRGRMLFDGRDIARRPAHARARLGFARSFQITSVVPGMRVLDNVILAVLAQAGRSFRFWRPARNDPALIGPALAALERVGLAEVAEERAGAVSHGEHRQLELAMTLAAEPELLLLDEPMAGMNVEEKEDMCRFVLDVNEQFGTTIALIEHDMGVVMDISDRVVVLDYGKLLADGTPAEVRANQQVIDAYLGVSHD